MYRLTLSIFLLLLLTFCQAQTKPADATSDGLGRAVIQKMLE